MVILNIADFFSAFLLTIFTGLMVYLGRETKKSAIPATMLIVYLVLLVVYAIQLTINKGQDPEITKTLSNCLAIDFVFIFISLFGYLWVDDIEAKKKKKKSVSNDLDWLWKKV